MKRNQHAVVFLTALVLLHQILCLASASGQIEVTIQQPRTPREAALNCEELRMPRVGLGSSKERLNRRLAYAGENSWLPQPQVDEFVNELKNIVCGDEFLREKQEGRLTNLQMLESAKRVNALNERFEELVLLSELAQPGKDGLLVRGQIIKERVLEALQLGKVSPQRAREYRTELKEIAAAATESADTMALKRLSARLSKLSIALDKNVSSPQVATKGPLRIGPRLAM